MADDYSYKLSLVFAITIHLLLAGFLFLKLAATKSNVALSSSNSVINATAISEHDLNAQMSKTLVNKRDQQPLIKKEAVVKPNPVVERQPIVPVDEIKKEAIEKGRLQAQLQKNLLKEQAREMAELKKERQQHKVAADKQKQQKQMQKILQEQLEAEQRDLAGANERAAGVAASSGGSHGGGEVDKHKALIIQAISSQWIVPEVVAGGDYCQILINVAPGGIVLDTKLIKSSGNVVLERSAQAAILKASPLPIPEEASLFDDFRAIQLTFRPEGIVGG